MSDDDLPKLSVPGTTSLTDLQLIIQQQEDELGPLQAIGDDGTDTILTFDDGRDPPDVPLELKLVNAPNEERDGFQRVAGGTCRVEVAEVSVGAFRAVAIGLLHNPAPDAPNVAPEVAEAPPELGKLSVKFETGGRGPGTV